MSRVLGVDYGETRVGVAISDPLAMTARPLEVVARDRAAARMAELAREYGVEKVVVGVPVPLRGGESASTAGAFRLGAQIAESTGLAVTFVDERFTSKMAEEALLESGMKRRKRRTTIDKVAAAIILQTYLDGNSQTLGDVETPGAQ